ncbi:MAG TPA: sulfite exporter TauE/SafE family protein [Thiotrichaceae bacterium]|jgi:uncharacterized membrane protein YfcA|nr:sulfite exporter TauE/SafE family protein [Thiotrichaceae bacterium]HIM07211.1 sulfite exporter TauE/SafE family protein [Gammaproteobacteria bacterium]
MSAVIIGIAIGLVLGLTGAGGSLFAVPLLILFLGLPVQEAMGLALAVVAASSLFGVLQRLKSNLILFTPGLLLALSGALFAPVGNWLATFLDSNTLIIGFMILTVIIAIRMWRHASAHPEEAVIVRAGQEETIEPAELLCKSGHKGKFELKPRCIASLVIGGSIVGFLSGLLGVGGGFLIVPLLMYISQMNINKAVSTSLLIITIISLSGFISYYLHSENFNWLLLGKIVSGGLIGMYLGTKTSAYIAGVRLQKIFAVTIVVFSTITLVHQY